jgi:hypothetical protein
MQIFERFTARRPARHKTANVLNEVALSPAPRGPRVRDCGAGKDLIADNIISLIQLIGVKTALTARLSIRGKSYDQAVAMTTARMV